MYKLQKFLLSQTTLFALLYSVVLSGCTQKATEPPFNVPALVGKKIDAVQAMLKLEPVANPAHLQTVAADGEEIRTYKKGDWYLLVAYKPPIGKVMSFTIGTDEDGGKLKDKERFLHAGMLRENDPLYNLDYIEANDTVFSYSGVRITPQPVSHTVVFRITGSQDVFYVTYSLRPASGAEKSHKFVVVPPWEESFTAATGTQLTLAATPSSQAVRRTTTGPIQATAQILLDGKIAQESKLSGLWARCELEIEY